MPAADAQNAMLILIRHAPIATTGHLFGRTDVPARVDPADIERVRARLSGDVDVVRSPALRCRQTTEALWPERSDFSEDDRLWEQNFGDHEAISILDLPDLGPMHSDALAAYTPPNGESFEAVCARAWPALQEASERALKLNRPVALVVHAGIVRAAIGLTLGQMGVAMSFEVAPLSVTRLRVGPDGPVSVMNVNETPQ
ncbi:histidine phosphatase family protein [Lentibacter sp. XHP0401]|uniref:histidine phosphatase family protein n=1 Tax=Lentibacter sp. XHP0401 TaxID=2984334 RepID=UPI0021E77F05|nr:histidine phosphatase family protein [Lentibacter sp. XHP0401]MCV2892062.1 histidine phosphatase family protein [Lentibacter sp. XHP0401]